MEPTIGRELPLRWTPTLGGAVLVVIGAGLVWRASRGGDTRSRLRGIRGTIVEETVAINRTPAELYSFWRNLDRLPSLMPELTSVQSIDDRHSHWVARGPAGRQTEWDAEIINDIKDELIAWRTTGNSDVVSAGSVHFDAGPPRRGTVVRVKLQYSPPGGKLGSAVAWALGDAPQQVIREGLRRFKQLMETGEIATTAGQPRGAR